MCLFRPSPLIDAGYFLTALNGPFVREQAKGRATGSAHPHLNLSDIKALAFPLPPLAEQRRIVKEVDRRVSVLRQFEIEVAANKSRTQVLRRAILDFAFARPYAKLDRIQR
jgi:type I restriction enzyme S subunit